ncbi:MAG: thiolase family protein [Anaerolineales bacterium]|nr:thiolase family protein [Anaerolineales bacterium]
MAFQNVFIPYGGYWSTPFVKWQGNFANLHPLTFAADVAKRALAERKIQPSAFDALYLGMTVPAKGSFYGAAWVAALIGGGAEHITGPTFSQACATSAQVIGSAAFEVETRHYSPRSEAERDGASLLCITADRTSNGPHMTYPNPNSPGGRPDAEDWVWDNFNCDPFARNAMIETAENVAREEEITTQEQHEVMLMRYGQYQDALKDDAAFHKRYMVTPVEVNPSGKKVVAAVKDDEGVFPTNADGLAKLKPVLPNGSVTFGAQTYPADGNAGMVVTTQERAAELSRDPAITVQILSFAQGRAKKGFMPAANVPATKRALELAGIGIGDVKAIKTHNPFAVNDIYFSREMGVKKEAMNNYGSSLIWGHPQGPTGMRLIAELVEELVLLGGGYGLFTGCAAGDTAAAVVVKVGK